MKIFNKKVILIFFVALLNCSTNNTYKDIHDLVESVKKENQLSSYPELLIDGYNFNYELIKDKINLKGEEIGYYSFTNNKGKGILKVITKLPEIEKIKYENFYVELNNSQISFDEFQKVELSKITKKIYLSSEKLDDPKYENYEKVLIIYMTNE
jgi:hypothetical protein